MTVRATQSLVILAAVLVSGSCGEGSTIPDAPSGASAAFLKAAIPPTNGARIVKILKRTTPLRADLATSGVIGPAGGHLSIPGAGLDVEFASGAVSAATRITITAIAGDGVAYEFQPHGLVFAAPVYVRQDLKKTVAEHDRAIALTLQGSYFDTDLKHAFVDGTTSFVRVKERRPAQFHSVRNLLEFTIEHFSGYLASIGFAGNTVDVQGD
jgi:hypothetical protein